jgi:hypothetical protein
MANLKFGQSNNDPLQRLREFSKQSQKHHQEFVKKSQKHFQDFIKQSQKNFDDFRKRSNDFHKKAIATAKRFGKGI